MQDGEIKLRAVEREHHVKRVRILAAPERIFDMGDLLERVRSIIDKAVLDDKGAVGAFSAP